MLSGILTYEFCFLYFSSHDNSSRVWRLTENGGAECLAMAIGHTLSVGSVALSQGLLYTALLVQIMFVGITKINM